jgi:hypothetical protein
MKLLLYLFSPGHPASGARSAVGRPQVDAASVRQGRVRAGAWPLRQALAVRRRPLRPRLPATASRHLEGRRSSTRPRTLEVSCCRSLSLQLTSAPAGSASPGSSILLPPSQNIESWSVQILCQNIRSWKDRTKFNEVGE